MTPEVMNPGGLRACQIESAVARAGILEVNEADLVGVAQEVGQAWVAVPQHGTMT